MVRYLRAANVLDGRLDLADVKEMNFSPSEQRTFGLLEGDILVTEGSGSIRTVGASAVWHAELQGPVCFQNTLLRVRPREGMDSRYLAWWCRHAFADGLFASAATGANIFHLSAERVRALRMQDRPLDEQRAIARYLDHKTAQIDALIASRARLSELLDERVGVAFDNAMEEVGFRMPTGLSERVLSDGEFCVPRLSQVLVQLTNGYVGPTRDILVDDGIRYVQSLHIKNGRIEFDRGHYFVKPEWHNERPRIHLREGDVLIVQTGDIGQVAVVPPGFGEASCHALQIARVRRSTLSGSYLAAYLRSPFGRASLLSRATGALHPHLEAGIKDIPVVVPPHDIQDRVVRQVDAVQRETHEIRSRIERQVAALQERRQALITVAVTGGIKVRVAA